MSIRVAEKVKSSKKRRRTSFVELRARLPLILRYLALAALIGAVIYLAVGYWRARNNKNFVMISGDPQLTNEVVAVINGYERRVTDANGKLQLFIKADKETTFADGRHELDNIFLENYPENSEKPDKISALKAVYTPNKDNPEDFVVIFSGNVELETRDQLKAKTQEIKYDRQQEHVETPLLIEFSRDNLLGKSIGAIVRVKEKKLELQSQVELFVEPNGKQTDNSLTDFGSSAVRINASRATVDQDFNRVELETGVFINIQPADSMNPPTTIRAEKAVYEKTSQKLDLTGGVVIVTASGGLHSLSGSQATSTNNIPATIRAHNAVFEQGKGKIFLNGNASVEQGNDLMTGDSITADINQKKQLQKLLTKGNAYLKSNADNRLTELRASEFLADFGANQKLQNANAKTEVNLMIDSPDRKTEIIAAEMNAQFGENQHISLATTSGGSQLKTQSSDRNIDVNAQVLKTEFDVNQQVTQATANGGVKVRSTDSENEINLTDANALTLNFQASLERSLLTKMRTAGNTNVKITALNKADYSVVTMASPNFLEVLFTPQDVRSLLKQMTTGGRTEIKMFAPESQNQNPKASNKRLLADSLKLFWNASGKDLSRAEANGNAQLFVEPLRTGQNIDRQSLFASKMDCSFFDTGNLAKVFMATGNAKAVLEPTVQQQDRGIRNLWANKLTANFERESQSVERFDAEGKAKFNELDRNGIGNSFSYSGTEEMVRLRGGEPTVWDSRARVKAIEIDWDTRRKVAYLRGKVATTYYSQEQTNGAAPFTKTDAPVFLTANQAELQNISGTGIYTGNARAWQDNNFVRAEKLILQRDTKSMYGEGKVQSLLYNAKRKEKGASVNVPVFAASDRIAYWDQQRLLRYESNVDIRQGTERITGGVAEVYLNANNEVEKTLAQNSVVITQPKRRATGNWAQYTAFDEVVILRGNPAYVEDSEQGNSQGAQLTVFLRDNRVVGEGTTKPNTPGRIRSTHKIKKN
jgi:lipopolysaccharide export system protein LptA